MGPGSIERERNDRDVPEYAGLVGNLHKKTL